MNAGLISGVVLVLGGICFVALVLTWIVQWRGIWRWLALAPSLHFVYIVLRLLYALHRDASSHNLWPLEVFFWGGIDVSLLMILRISHGIFTWWRLRSRKSKGSQGSGNS